MMRLFIADDSAIIRECLVNFLSELEGIEIVGQAKDWPEAVEGIKKLKPDVAILDFCMPNGDGILTIESIKRNKFPPIVIMFTNYSYPQHRKKSMDAGADYFFEKCSEYQELADTLEQLARDVSHKIAQDKCPKIPM